MTGVPAPDVSAELIGPAAGRLRWTRDGANFVARGYRVRLSGPRHWVIEFRGTVLGSYTRRSMALAAAEHHRRDVERVHQIAFWAFLAGVALTSALVAAGRLTSPAGFFMMAASVGVFLGSVARCLAALSKNLLDPYRARESWEPADWWNH